jgi:signal peptidase I
VYLRYIPNPKKEDDPSSLQNDKTIDVSFGIRLVGNQQSQLPKFDLEWRAGMRFASSTCLRKGYAQDFGAHLLQSRLLPEFLGIQPNVQNDDDDDDEAYQHNHKLNIQVNMILHRPNTAPTMPYQQHQDKDDAVKSAAAAAAPSDAMLLYNINFGKLFRGGLDRIFQDMRQFSSSSSNQHDSTTNDDQDKGVRVGKIVVPVLQKLAQRPKLMAMGCYPGVEYRILRILAHSNNKNTSIIGNHNNSCVEEDIFYHRPGASYVIKPIYPLVPALERAWPVTVPEQDIPLLVSPTSYNILSAVGSLATAVTGLLAAFCVSQAISVFYIPSKSMEPTLNVGNVLLVEKITSRVYTSTLSSFLQSDSYYRVGDVILFEPPYQLREFVLSNGGRLTNRDLFVKRVAGIPGDRLEIDEAGSVVGITRIDGVSGEVKFLPNQNRNLCGEEPLGLIRQYVSKKVIIVPPKSVAVLGDCSSVSIDSRVWGVLPMENIVGRPLFRIWPASEFGLVPSIAASTKSPIHPEQQLSSPLVTQWQEDN